MAHLFDMVPNHMGVGSDNQWWMDVLENGRLSFYADFFDINWQPRQEELQDRILLPVLGNHYGAELEGGRLRLVFCPSQGAFYIQYYEQRFPVAPPTYPAILGFDLARLEARLGSRHKGVEDTFLYIYNRLLSLNEVGCEPRRFGVSVAVFHHANSDRQLHWPHAMLNTSTHDSKRSEDVRARISVLSEMPRQWRSTVRDWSRINRRHKTKVENKWVPAKNDEYAFYQTLLGVWPLREPDQAGCNELAERLAAYMLKAVREAKMHTSWTNRDPAYEEAMTTFVRAILAEPVINFRPASGRVLPGRSPRPCSPRRRSARGPGPGRPGVRKAGSAGKRCLFLSG